MMRYFGLFDPLEVKSTLPLLSFMCYYMSFICNQLMIGQALDHAGLQLVEALIVATINKKYIRNTFFWLSHYYTLYPIC